MLDLLFYTLSKSSGSLSGVLAVELLRSPFFLYVSQHILTFPSIETYWLIKYLLAQVSYEYIACQQARQGVMILSEFAGAAQSLNGSIVVNPWDSQQVADSIFEAVTMDAETRAENHRKLFKVSLAVDGRSLFVC